MRPYLACLQLDSNTFYFYDTGILKEFYDVMHDTYNKRYSKKKRVKVNVNIL